MSTNLTRRLSPAYRLVGGRIQPNTALVALSVSEIHTVLDAIDLGLEQLMEWSKDRLTREDRIENRQMRQQFTRMAERLLKHAPEHYLAASFDPRTVAKRAAEFVLLLNEPVVAPERPVTDRNGTKATNGHSSPNNTSPQKPPSPPRNRPNLPRREVTAKPWEGR